MTYSAQSRTARGRILLVDDEQEFTDLMGTLLGEGLGATVHAFNCPRAAADAFESIGPDFVVTDFFMPELTGFQLLRALEQRKPGLKSLVITGNNVDPGELDPERPGHLVAVLNKPVSWRQIAAIVREHTTIGAA